YFIGRGRWWRSVDGADYRRFERFASDEGYYQESHHSSKMMMLFLPVSESRRVKGVFSLTAEDVASYVKLGKKLPTKLHILMPSSSEDSVYQDDAKFNRIPRRDDLFFKIEELEAINVVEHIPFPTKEDPKPKAGLNEKKLATAVIKLLTDLYANETKKLIEQAHVLNDFRITISDADLKNLIETKAPEMIPVEHYEQVFLVITMSHYLWDPERVGKKGRGKGNPNKEIELDLTDGGFGKKIVSAETIDNWVKNLHEKYRIR
ncbi:MAG: hypothetical protein IBX56_06000, partial [Methylomicrobium sp.]|nr:hypothetical protein [Methylomicrobium sp.]